MSIPIFFQTYTLTHVHGNPDTWKRRLDWKIDKLPHKAQFVDGLAQLFYGGGREN